MNFKNVVLLLLYSFALFQGFQGEACDPKPMIMRHEGKKECVYLDTKGIKTIGVGFNMQNKEAPAVFASIGADYNSLSAALWPNGVLLVIALQSLVSLKGR